MQARAPEEAAVAGAVGLLGLSGQVVVIHDVIRSAPGSGRSPGCTRKRSFFSALDSTRLLPRAAELHSVRLTIRNRALDAEPCIEGERSAHPGGPILVMATAVYV